MTLIQVNETQTINPEQVANLFRYLDRDNEVIGTVIGLSDGESVYIRGIMIKEMTELLNGEIKPEPKLVTLMDKNGHEMAIDPSIVKSVHWNPENQSIIVKICRQYGDELGFRIQGPASRTGEVIAKLNGTKIKKAEESPGRTLEV